MDAASLVIVLHGELLRTCSSVVQEHFQGLAQAGWYRRAMVGLGPCSAAIHDVSYENFINCVGVLRVENVVGQACERVSLHSNSLRNSRESVKNYSVFA